MIVTKKELVDFVNSFGELHIMKDSPLKESLIELGEHFNNYILYGKPNDYVLKKWEFNELMYEHILYNKNRFISIFYSIQTRL